MKPGQMKSEPIQLDYDGDQIVYPLKIRDKVRLGEALDADEVKAIVYGLLEGTKEVSQAALCTEGYFDKMLSKFLMQGVGYFTLRWHRGRQDTWSGEWSEDEFAGQIPVRAEA